jgi:two-component system invasion response regulator UvrY
MSQRFLVVEDHPIVHLGLRQLMAGRWPDAAVDIATTLKEAEAWVTSTSYDIAVVDLNLPDAAGLDSVTRLRRIKPDLKLLVLSLNDETAYAQRVLQLGASGYLSKERAPTELIRAMERIRDGHRYITASQAERIAVASLGDVPREPHEALSMQEYRVMTYLAKGKRLTEIAELMHLSPKTITTYRARVLEKVGVENNQGLVKYCLDRGIAID